MGKGKCLSGVLMSHKAIRGVVAIGLYSGCTQQQNLTSSEGAQSSQASVQPGKEKSATLLYVFAGWNWWNTRGGHRVPAALPSWHNRVEEQSGGRSLGVPWWKALCWLELKLPESSQCLEGSASLLQRCTLTWHNTTRLTIVLFSVFLCFFFLGPTGQQLNHWWHKVRWLSSWFAFEKVNQHQSWDETVRLKGCLSSGPLPVPVLNVTLTLLNSNSPTRWHHSVWAFCTGEPRVTRWVLPNYDNYVGVVNSAILLSSHCVR